MANVSWMRPAPQRLQRWRRRRCVCCSVRRGLSLQVLSARSTVCTRTVTQTMSMRFAGQAQGVVLARLLLSPQEASAVSNNSRRSDDVAANWTGYGQACKSSNDRR